ncbi:MAG: GAF domain-containing protein [Armatimonadetes bacterium]|nr:GAF domain-containing protein [Armatimonadota bacterium]
MVNPDAALHIVLTLQRSEQIGSELRGLAMTLLDALPGYDWSGIYVLDGDLLRLAEYVGEPTDHTLIPVGRGVCGTSVAENRNQVIDDVNALENYLSCSLKTKAEIVVLIRDREGKVLGQIDVDSHTQGAFDSSDERLLTQVAGILASKW